MKEKNHNKAASGAVNGGVDRAPLARTMRAASELEERARHREPPFRAPRWPTLPDEQARPHDRELRIAVDSDEQARPLDGKLRIAVDFDGVLFDHIPYVLRGFRDAYGIDLEEEGLRYWDFFQYRAVREKGLSWNCVRNILRDIETDAVLHEAPPRDRHARHVLRRWRAQGHEVHVVTAREPESRDVTELFLRTHDIPHDDLVMGAARKTGYDILIDDAPHNVLMAAAAGGLALLMDHPYNRDVPTGRNPFRARDWHAVEHVVESLPRQARALVA